MVERIILISSRDIADYGRRMAASGVRGFIAKAELSGAKIRSILADPDPSPAGAPEA
jgi:hypothetical protein